MSRATLSRPKAKRIWTYDEFAAASAETNLPTELWDGEIIRSAAPRPVHQRVVLPVVQCMDDHERPRKVGEVFVSPIDVVFSGSKAVQPDVVFVSTANESIEQENCVRGVPELLVEVIPGVAG